MLSQGPKARRCCAPPDGCRESIRARVRGRPRRRVGARAAGKEASSWLLHLIAVALGQGHGQNLIIKWTREFQALFMTNIERIFVLKNF